MADFKVYEWKRQTKKGWQYRTTESHETPPSGKGWQRSYRFGIGSVPGAGGSPARSS